MESNVMTIRTKADRAWTMFKLVDKYSLYQTDVRVYEREDDQNEVEVRFVLKKILGSTKLAKKIFIKKAKKELL